MCLRCPDSWTQSRCSTQSNLNINNNTCNLPITDKTPMKGYSHFSKCMSEACVVLKNGQQVVVQGPDGAMRWLGKAARVRGVLVASALTGLFSPHCCFVHTGARCASLPPLRPPDCCPRLSQKGKTHSHKHVKTTEQINKPERQVCATHRDLPRDCGKCLNDKEEKRVEDMFGPFDLSWNIIAWQCGGGVFCFFVPLLLYVSGGITLSHLYLLILNIKKRSAHLIWCWWNNLLDLSLRCVKFL